MHDNKELTKEQQIKFGRELLKIKDKETVIDLSKENQDINATYICEPIKGGGAIIVSADGTVLFANSSVNFDTHLEEFKKGRRTSVKDFENL